MPVTYENQKGDTYYLHWRTTRAGNVTYTCSTKEEGNVVDEMPEAYEFWELPSGQVFARKARPGQVTKAELAVVETGIGQFADVPHYRVYRTEDTITVHLPNSSPQLLARHLAAEMGVPPSLAETSLAKHGIYVPALRFALIDTEGEARLFQTQEPHHPHDEVSWWAVGDPGPLAEVVRRYASMLA
jgi:hypothetical protein